MPFAEGRFEEGITSQFRQYQLELRGQFRRSFISYSLAMLVLFVVLPVLPLALCIAAIWTLMLSLEAQAAFGKSAGVESHRFQRWQRRQVWLAAAPGDKGSLKRLQNVR